MLMLLVFFPLLNFLYIWVLEIFLGKYKASYCVAYLYIVIVCLSLKMFYKVCLLGHFQYLTIGT